MLCEIFDKKISPLTVKAYFAALSRFDIGEVERAITEAMTRCKFFPKPVELIEFITGDPADVESRAHIEAGQVIGAIRRIGQYESVQFSDPITSAVILHGFGGWVQICRESTIKTEKWVQRDFVRLYQAYTKQQVEHDGCLPGLIEQENSARGFFNHLPEPVAIGFKPKKQIVFKNEDEFQKIGHKDNSKPEKEIEHVGNS